MSTKALSEQIRTVKGFSESKEKEKGSLFIGRCYYVSDIKEVNTILNQNKKEFYDATHHCYAFLLNNGEKKYSDDGEPGGTAGVRILNAIEHFELTDVLVIVIRYFGGTKLGVGPLGKAYYQSAFNAISTGEIITKSAYVFIKIFIDYQAVNNVYKILTDNNAKIIRSEETGEFFIPVYVNPSGIDDVKTKIINSTKGKASFWVSETVEYL